MKKILILTSFILASINIDAQVIKFNPAAQTITTSSSLDTLTFDITTIYSPQYYEFQLSADSLSGATGATCYLELNIDGDGEDWYPLETVVVDGVTTRARGTGSFLAGTIRCRCLAPSSTQSTAVRVDVALSSK